jgi:hypothetical protein
MKITDFGLWFKYFERRPPFSELWSLTIPQDARCFDIYYDGWHLGEWSMSQQGRLYVYRGAITPHIIINKRLDVKRPNWYHIGITPTMEGLEIVPNPDYKEIP